MRMSKVLLSIASGVLVLCLGGNGTSQVILPPCCTSPSSVMQELANRPPTEPEDHEALWLRNRVAGFSPDDLREMRAAITGACATACSPKYSLAEAVLDDLLSQDGAGRHREDNRIHLV